MVNSTASSRYRATSRSKRLETLAIEDGLTNLANRRRFDERLQEQWARAPSRWQTAVIVDDRYRPVQEIQRSVWASGGRCVLAFRRRGLAAEAQRITDLAARYGGEEFAVLLPNTDAAGCWRIGERIRGALREAGIPHALNPPSGLVTASLGGAGAWPAAERSAGPASLVERADRALYAAKTVGVIDWSFHVKSWRCFPSHRPGDDGSRNRRSSGSEI
jgi:diguanylate cyclase (GGDEF)-like protein